MTLVHRRVAGLSLIAFVACESESPCPAFCDAAASSDCVFVFGDDCLGDCERIRSGYDDRGCLGEWDDALTCFVENPPRCDASGQPTGSTSDPPCEEQLDEVEDCMGIHLE